MERNKQNQSSEPSSSEASTMVSKPGLFDGFCGCILGAGATSIHDELRLLIWLAIEDPSIGFTITLESRDFDDCSNNLWLHERNMVGCFDDIEDVSLCVFI